MRTILSLLCLFTCFWSSAQEFRATERDKTFNVYNRNEEQVKGYASSFLQSEGKSLSDSLNGFVSSYTFLSAGGKCYDGLRVEAEMYLQYKFGLTKISFYNFRYSKKVGDSYEPLSGQELRCILEGGYNDCQTCMGARRRWHKDFFDAMDSYADRYHDWLKMSTKKETKF